MSLFFVFPWQYVALAPLVARVISAKFYGGQDPAGMSYHTLILVSIRLLMNHLFLLASRAPVIVPGYKIQRKGINFEQVDREEQW